MLDDLCRHMAESSTWTSANSKGRHQERAKQDSEHDINNKMSLELGLKRPCLQGLRLAALCFK
jgi:hypothetical protein